jgi:hypothetical protein
MVKSLSPYDSYAIFEMILIFMLICSRRGSPAWLSFVQHPLEKYRIEFIEFHCVNLEELKNKWSPAVFPYLDVSEHWRKSLSWGGNVWKTGQRVQQDLSVAPVYLGTVGGGIAWSLKFL